jgi:hypothetical protein
MRFAFILTIIFLLNACQTKKEQPQLYKTWHMVYDMEAQLSLLDSQRKALLDSLPEKSRLKALKMTEEQVKKNSLTFKKDNTFELNTKGEEIIQKGTWKLKDKDKLILTQDGQKNYTELIIQKLQSDTLIVISKQKNGTYSKTIFIAS